MSAAPQHIPKKPLRSERDRINDGRWFPYSNDWAEQLEWVAGNQCEQVLVERVMVEQNKRKAYLIDRGRPQDGWSFFFTLTQFADGSKWDLRTWQRSLANLRALEVLECQTREEAVRGGLFTKKEAGRPVDGLYTCRVHWELFAGIVERRRREAEERKADYPSDQPDLEASEEMPRTKRLTQKPITLGEGKKNARITLDPAPVKELRIQYGGSSLKDFSVTQGAERVTVLIADASRRDSPKANERRTRSDTPVVSPQVAHSNRHTNGSSGISADFPSFIRALRNQFPSTGDSLITEGIDACRAEARARGLDPAGVNDKFLCWALEKTSVFKRQRSAVPYFRPKKNGDKGNLVQTVAAVLDRANDPTFDPNSFGKVRSRRDQESLEFIEEMLNDRCRTR